VISQRIGRLNRPIRALFLDKVGDIPIEIQPTNRDLLAAIAAGAFRAGLFLQIEHSDRRPESTIQLRYPT